MSVDAAKDKLAEALHWVYAQGLGLGDREWDGELFTVKSDFLLDADAVLEVLEDHGFFIRNKAGMASEYNKGYLDGKDEGFFEGWEAAND